MYSIVVTVIALMYICWDINYFIRIFITVVFSRLIQKKVGINESTEIYGFCTTQDVDFFLVHMNNARYLRELDFARINFYDRTGIYRKCRSLGGDGVQGAASIRYRKPIPIFTAYKVETKLVYWEEKTLFLEQQFVTLHDGFIRCVVHSRQNLIGVDVEAVLEGLPGLQEKPSCPPEIQHWLQAIEVSSSKLRKTD